MHRTVSQAKSLGFAPALRLFDDGAVGGFSKRIGVQIGVRFNANLDHAVLFGACDAHQNISRLTLASVQCCAFGLAHTTRNKPPRTGDAAAIIAGNRDLNPRIQTGLINRLIFTHKQSDPTAITQGHLMFNGGRHDMNGRLIRTQKPPISPLWRLEASAIAFASSAGPQHIATARCQM